MEIVSVLDVANGAENNSAIQLLSETNAPALSPGVENAATSPGASGVEEVIMAVRAAAEEFAANKTITRPAQPARRAIREQFVIRRVAFIYRGAVQTSESIQCFNQIGILGGLD